MTQEAMIERAKQVFAVEMEGLSRVRESLGEAFVKTVKLLLACLDREGIIVVSGVGKNLHIAEKMSAIFASTGSRSIVLNPVQAMHGDLGMVSPKDVLVALSYSGESAEVINLIPAVRRHGLKVVSITGFKDSTLGRLADVCLPIPCGKEACPFGMAPTNSATSTMAMGDALAMVLIDARKFDKASYALNHPAGAIGRALVLKVTDVMRKGSKLAMVAPEATVLEAILAMTKAGSGSAVIAGCDGKLAGIFTDGDFRRHVSCGRDILNDPVSDYMTARPMFVRNDTYAAEVLKVFEQKRIDDLPVCDAAGRVVGLVDLQDLPKMKVF